MANPNYESVVEEFQSSLECPVCLLIPREVPIPSCCAGHIICKSCRKKVTSCPTCRVPYNSKNSMTNSLASSLIATVLHKCKYSQYNCNVKLKLNDIVNHERKCPERTVKCPDPECQEVVQMRSYDEHPCTYNMSNRFSYPVSSGYLQWDGVSRRDHDEMNPSEDQGFRIARTNFLGKYFYCYPNFRKDEKTFSFTLFTADNPEVASKFKSRISIFNEDSSRRLTYEGEVLAIEEIPSPWGNFTELNRRCLCIPYETIRQFFWIKDVGEKDKVWKVSLYMEVQVFKKKG